MCRGVCVGVCVCVCTSLRYLRDEPLVFTQPGFSHGSLAVEAARQLLQLLLANQLRPQSQLALMLRLLQALPRLAHTHTSLAVYCSHSPFMLQHDRSNDNVFTQRTVSK